MLPPTSHAVYVTKLIKLYCVICINLGELIFWELSLPCQSLEVCLNKSSMSQVNGWHFDVFSKKEKWLGERNPCFKILSEVPLGAPLYVQRLKQRQVTRQEADKSSYGWFNFSTFQEQSNEGALQCVLKFLRTPIFIKNLQCLLKKQL